MTSNKNTVARGLTPKNIFVSEIDINGTRMFTPVIAGLHHAQKMSKIRTWSLEEIDSEALGFVVYYMVCPKTTKPNVDFSFDDEDGDDELWNEANCGSTPEWYGMKSNVKALIKGTTSIFNTGKDSERYSSLQAFVQDVYKGKTKNEIETGVKKIVGKLVLR